MTRSVHWHRHGVLIIPLTVLFHRAIRRVPTVIRDLKQSGRKSQGRLRLKNKFLFLIRILKMAAFVYRLIRRQEALSSKWKEMYKVLKRTCWAIVLPIRSFVFSCPRCRRRRRRRRRRRLLKIPIIFVVSLSK